MPSSTDWLFGENKIQRPVVINGKILESLPQIRAANFANENFRKDRMYGSTIAMPGGLPSALLNVKRYRPVFHHRKAQRLTGFEDYAESSVAVIQSLNGLYVEPRITTRAGFAREWRCPGFSMTAYDFDIKEQTPSGVAVMISGSLDTLNNGPHTWVPGDRIVFEAPAWDRLTALAERNAVGEIEGESPQRVDFILKPVRYVESTLWFEHAFSRIFADGYAERFVVDKLFETIHPEDEDAPADRAANQLFSFIKTVAAATVFTLIHNEVNLNTGVTWGLNGVLDQANIATYSAVRNRLNVNLQQQIADKGPNSNFRTNNSSNLRAWLHLLGLVPARATGSQKLPEARAFIDQITGLTCRSIVQLKGVYDLFDITSFFPDTERAAAFDVATRALNPDDRLGALALTVRGALRGTVQGMKDSVVEQMNAYVATANEVTAPGQPGNVRR